ncbi:MAG: SOS response-associated peptidase [Haliea sp.]|jgi:putative SOS response-associated peptidase YedK|nr:SOS response-associated peptidase [Haliea sp.]
MCGRFNVIDNPGLQQLLRDLGIDLKLPGGVNIAPTEDIPLLRRDDSGASVALAHWWLVPSWAKEINQKYSMFNARSETLGKSPAFRHPFKSQRGLVPMSSFIEWRPEGGVKQPWLITSEDHALAVAALWDLWEGGESPLLSCTLVTTAAAPEFEPWHKRMPVLLTPDESARWLDNSRPIDGDDPLFRNELKMPLLLQPLSRAVSNSRHKDIQVLRSEGDIIELR